MMKLLAEAENKLLYIDREGEFYFKSKEIDASTASYHFSGLSDGDKSYGHNIIGKLAVNNSLQKVYNKVIIKFDKADTTTSYIVKKEKWTYGDGTSPFLYGERLYEYSNEYLTHETAEIIANNILTEYVYPKEEIKFLAKYAPQLSVNDHVTVTYRTRHYQSGDLWGFFEWGKGKWGNRTGYNIDIYKQSIKILKIKHNFDKYTTEITGRVI